MYNPVIIKFVFVVYTHTVNTHHKGILYNRIIEYQQSFTGKQPV